VGSLRRAVDASPDDVALRLHLAQMLLTAGESDEAITHASAALSREPQSSEARRIMSDALAGPVAGAQDASAAEGAPKDFDWHAAESQVEDLAAPMFATGGDPTIAAFDAETSTIKLADVGGMQTVKDRLESAFLAPLRNPELRKLYGKSLRGGLLMYGPPGCGKTFIARAVAGELGAKFVSVGLSDILDPMMGTSEQNIHDAFELARREAPCVLFFDEIDALGQRRTMTRNNGMRGVVVQLLQELDGVDQANEGVFVLAATNQPWDIDPALRRPGRFDRTVLVLPPDSAARRAIFQLHLRERPVEGIDLDALAVRSEGLTGADIAYACELASEKALLDSIRTGTPRMITTADVLSSLGEVPPSAIGWMDSVRNVVLFGEDDGTFAELRSYLKKAKRL